MIKYFKKYIFISFVFCFIFITNSTVIAEKLPGLGKTAEEIGYDRVPVDYASIMIGWIIQLVLGFIGVIFMVIILMGAFDIQGAGGNDEAVKKGKDKIKNGAIGLTIVFAAYIISYILIKWIAGGIFIVNNMPAA